MQPDINDTKKIKLLILTPTLECGGSEKYVSLLCNNINSQQFAVKLAVLNNEASFYTINNKDVIVIDLKVKHARSSLFKIKSLVKQHKPDIIFSTSNHLNIYLAVFRQLFSKKIIFIARESSVVVRSGLAFSIMEMRFRSVSITSILHSLFANVE